jgi:hypothetical protein
MWSTNPLDFLDAFLDLTFFLRRQRRTQPEDGGLCLLE